MSDSDYAVGEAVCFNCRHWNRIDGSENGFCFRFPPTPCFNGQKTVSDRPETPLDSWCGEFTPNQ